MRVKDTAMHLSRSANELGSTIDEDRRRMLGLLGIVILAEVFSVTCLIAQRA
jgi:hypothetical protein